MSSYVQTLAVSSVGSATASVGSATFSVGSAGGSVTSGVAVAQAARKTVASTTIVATYRTLDSFISFSPSFDVLEIKLSEVQFPGRTAPPNSAYIRDECKAF